MKKEYLTIPNFVTSLRIVGAIILLFLKPFSTLFFVVYSFTGFTDAIDGFLARKLNQVSVFGSKLDSVSDLIFYNILGVKIFPTLYKKLPIFIWYVVIFVFIIRIIIYLYVAFKNKELISNHTYLNKATGLLIFGLPYVTLSSLCEAYSWMTVGIALVAAIQEFSYVLLKKDIRL